MAAGRAQPAEEEPLFWERLELSGCYKPPREGAAGALARHPWVLFRGARTASEEASHAPKGPRGSETAGPRRFLCCFLDSPSLLPLIDGPCEQSYEERAPNTSRVVVRFAKGMPHLFRKSSAAGCSKTGRGGRAGGCRPSSRPPFPWSS